MEKVRSNRWSVLLTARLNPQLRKATEADVADLERLIPLSVRSLQAQHYSSALVEAALGPVFGVDRNLIRDGTYFVITLENQIVACGGWSRRKALFGGDQHQGCSAEPLDPNTEPARIRAFFVHPNFVRKGLGRMILQASEDAAREAGFTRGELVATLTGEPLYAAGGYDVLERYEIPLAGGLMLPATRMGKVLRHGEGMA
jgi:GNAT superfamily N-acetyltransferase